MGSIDDVKNIPIFNVVEKYCPNSTIQLDGQGRLKCCCPLHSEHSPSFKIYTASNSFYCYGCHKGGSGIDFLMHLQNLDFLSAARQVARDFGIHLIPLTKEEEDGYKKHQQHQDILTKFVSRCHTQLKPSHRTHLHDRGLTDETINKFKIGYEPARTPWNEEEAQELGFVTDGGKYLPGERLILSVFAYGKPIYVLFYDLERNEPRYLFPRGLTKPLVGIETVRDSSEPHVVEGIYDYYSFCQAELPVICLLGNRLKDEDKPKLARAKRIFTCLDGDEGGRQGEADILDDFFPNARKVTLPEGKDPNDLLKENPDGFREQILTLAKASENLLDTKTKKMGEIEQPWERNTFIKEQLVPLLKRLDPAEQRQWVNKNSKIMGFTWVAFKEFLKPPKEEEKSAPQKFDFGNALHTTMLHPTLDVTESVVVIGGRVSMPKDETVEEKEIFLISDGHNIELTESVSFVRQEQNFLINIKDKFLPQLTERWRLRDIKSLMDEGLSGARPTGTYEKIKSLSQKYFDFWNEEIHGLLAAFTIGTYFFPLFAAYPYLHVFGPKGTGKSKLLAFLEALCFNGVKMQEITVAGIGDSIDSCRSTICLDQAERLANSQDIDISRLVGYLADGYKKDGGKRRIVELTNNGRRLREFASFSPKVFGSIKDLHYDLRDRCVPIKTKRAEHPVPEKVEEDFFGLRDQLYRLLLSSFKAIIEIEKSVNDFSDRRLELWKPIGAVLKLEGVTSEEYNKIKIFFNTVLDGDTSTISEWDERLIAVIFDQFGIQNQIDIEASHLSYRVASGDEKITEKTIGKIILKLNLASKKDRPRRRTTVAGVSLLQRPTIYTFHRDHVLRIARMYDVPVDEVDSVPVNAPLQGDLLKYQDVVKRTKPDSSSGSTGDFPNGVVQ